MKGNLIILIKVLRATSKRIYNNCLILGLDWNRALFLKVFSLFILYVLFTVQYYYTKTVRLFLCQISDER